MVRSTVNPQMKPFVPLAASTFPYLELPRTTNPLKNVVECPGILEQTFPTEHEDLCVSECLGLIAAVFHCGRSHLSVWDLWQPPWLLPRYQRVCSSLNNEKRLQHCPMCPGTRNYWCVQTLEKRIDSVWVQI